MTFPSSAWRLVKVWRKCPTSRSIDSIIAESTLARMNHTCDGKTAVSPLVGRVLIAVFAVDEFRNQAVGFVNLGHGFQDSARINGDRPGLIAGVAVIKYQRLNVSVEDKASQTGCCRSRAGETCRALRTSRTVSRFARSRPANSPGVDRQKAPAQAGDPCGSWSAACSRAR